MSKRVSVAGYTKSNGTYVSGYTRSSPSTSGRSVGGSSAGRSGGGSSAVQVSAYTRSNGTHVAAHTRSTASKAGGGSSSSVVSPSTTGVVHVSGHTRSDGTWVKPHVRSSPAKAATVSEKSSTSSISVAGYTKANGTVVKPHERSHPGTSSTPHKGTIGTSRPIIDLRSAAVKRGLITFRNDGSVDPNCNAVKSGTLKLRNNGQPNLSSAVFRRGEALPLPSLIGKKNATPMQIDQTVDLEEKFDLLDFLRNTLDSTNQINDEYMDDIRTELSDAKDINDFDQYRGAITLSNVPMSSLENEESKKSGLEKNAEERGIAILSFSELNVQKQRVLGSGSFGEVFLGTYQGNPIAVKLLRQVPRPSHHKEVISEMEVFSRIKSPHVVRLVGICMEDNHWGIASELMRGGSLYNAIHVTQTAQKWPLCLKLAVLSQAACGLSHLHKEGIAHRDMKSGNLLLDGNSEDLTCKIADFGLSQIRDESTASSKLSAGGMVGTIMYSAPEQFSDSLGIDWKAADIYSLGVVVWELLTMSVPFEGMRFEALMRKKLMWADGDPHLLVIPQDIPELVKDLLYSCWSSPPKRPSAQKMSEVLESAANISAGKEEKPEQEV